MSKRRRDVEVEDEYIPIKKRKLNFEEYYKEKEKSIKSARHEEQAKKRLEERKRKANGRDMRSLIDINYDLISKGKIYM